MAESVKRNVSAHLIIEELCRELHMSEEALLVHLALGAAANTLSKAGQNRVMWRAHGYHLAGIYEMEVERT